MAKVELYSKEYCPYCTRAIALLRHKGVEFQQIKIDLDPEKRPEMIARSNGSYTVPQIFINDIGVGGCDELYALDSNNELDSMLA
jgi:glutaredoxin 3